METRHGRKACVKVAAQERLPSLDYVVLSSLIALQFILLLTIALQVVGA